MKMSRFFYSLLNSRFSRIYGLSLPQNLKKRSGKIHLLEMWNRKGIPSFSAH